MRSNKLLLGVVAAAAAIGVFWFLLLAPKRDEVAALGEQITQKQSEISQAEATLASYRTASEDYKVNYATIARLGKAVPADDDVKSLMVQIEDAAANSKIDFRSIAVSGGGSSSPGTESTGRAAPPGAQAIGPAGFSVMPFTFEFSGSYMELSRFFNKLESFVQVENERIDVSGRLLRLESIKLVPSGEGYKTLTASVTASSYLTPATEGLTADATATAPAGAADPATSGTPVIPAISTGALR